MLLGMRTIVVSHNFAEQLVRVLSPSRARYVSPPCLSSSSTVRCLSQSPAATST
ncbi:hypothetical protein Scep_023949 [Stephania cephalantha]|uniref:Uncharacterized protein n=1 Tax=Stephania cephalantha TaxID=152367 RepID=A0AAP0EW50_9MAGN